LFMYLNYFNLKREPFNITPDPELLYLSPSHKEALAAVIYGVNSRKGFVEITGEVGVGKTTIIRSFLDRIDKQNVRAIYIFNANISFKALLRTIYQNLRQVPQTDEVSEMVNQLHMTLIDEYKVGRNVVLIIDEAQNMPVETLENLRMLSNLETSTDKLIQIVFSGQPEFEERLKVYALRQLKQRIAIRVKILPLSRKESLEYINHRLSRSLIKDTNPFTRGALDIITRKAGGIPRIINIYCDNCLVTSFGNQQKTVTSRVAQEIISEQEGGRQVRQNWKIAFVTALLVAVCAVLFYVKNGLTLPAPAPSKADKKSDVLIAVARSIQAVQPAPVEPAKESPDGAGAKPAAAKQENAVMEDGSWSANSQVHRVARRGDTLAKLVLETYGSVDRKLLELVKQRNPRITNINLIQEGEKIYFPARDK
jgi:general secretion pathway protein A